MCNSYNNGHCDYYGVEVSELNYKCERGKFMEKIDPTKKLPNKPKTQVPLKPMEDKS